MTLSIYPRIQLEESTHTYLLDDSEDIAFKSVTTFIGQFFDEFDAEKIATKLVRTHPDNYSNGTAKLSQNDISDELKVMNTERVDLFEKIKN